MQSGTQSRSAVCSEKVISEVSGKRLLRRRVQKRADGAKCVTVGGRTDWDELCKQNTWLRTQSGLVVKPDQSIKRRKHLGLIQLNVDFDTAKLWIQEKLGSKVKVDGVEGTLKQFLIEPYLPHQENEESYLCIYCHTESHDAVLFHSKGGVDVGNVDEEADHLYVGLEEMPQQQTIQETLLKNVQNTKTQMLCSFIQSLIKCFRDLHFTYLELNPLVVTDSEIHILDVAAKVDSKAAPLCKELWDGIQFAPSLCRDLHPEELRIAQLAAGTPCSMNLTILNKAGRIWSLIAGGGTSLVMSDTAAELGVRDEVACYTQFSGRPSADQMYEFTKTLIDLMVEVPHPEGKTFILSSNVADMIMMIKLKVGPMQGLMRALQECKEKLKTHKISLLMRRATLATVSKGQIPSALTELGLPVHIFSIAVPMTHLIQCALGLRDVETGVDDTDKICQPMNQQAESHEVIAKNNLDEIFNGDTKVIVVGLMTQAVQAMLDFDFVCGRKTPSVDAIVNPGGEDKEESFLWAEGQVSIPVYSSLETAMSNHTDATVVVNSAPGRDAYHCAMLAVKCRHIRCILMIAGHIPDRQTRTLVQMAHNNGVLIVGPCTPVHLMQVNFIKPGSFRCNKFGTIGGSLDDLVSLRLYRPGSVGVVTRSGGLSMELIIYIARNTDGLYQGVSLGGGKCTGSSFMDHLMSMQANPDVKILLLLGEFGGSEEYDICEALRSGKLSKPMVAFCIGECADMFKSEPGYFGHSGAGNDVALETAAAKNQALAEAGAIVPKTFDEIGDKLREVYASLIAKGQLVPKPEPPVPSIPANMKPRKGKK
ncbi:ATP-citrate synthase-like [Patiria miniata]|uniref:ATP citrate synthase n=1 Tax=Patiria miniata TaxID=46514 RepID=A0A913ZBS4_PATMI|nr:ATP-citrate synthase-like [Patiria miniata]